MKEKEGNMNEKDIDMNAKKGSVTYYKTLEFLKEKYGILKPI